jgi:DNA-directed RNA polymerase subunit beta'
MLEVNDFNAVRISLASPEQIRSWSYGEVTKPETINYRTLKPEKDGLFCEKIFGPMKDFECYCGKYKRVRYKGIICDKCGVEVARAKVRRERMGHIELASPVSHIWFVKGTPSRLGLLLDMSPRSLERVLYFAQHIITEVDETGKSREVEALRNEMERVAGERETEYSTRIVTLEGERQQTVDVAQQERDTQLAAIEERFQANVNAVMQEAQALEAQLAEQDGKKAKADLALGDQTIVAKGGAVSAKSVAALREAVQTRVAAYEVDANQERDDAKLLADAAVQAAQATYLEGAGPMQERIREIRAAVVEEFRERFEALDRLKDPVTEDRVTLLTETEHRVAWDNFGHIFKAGMGAEAVLHILNRLDLERLRERLNQEILSSSGQRRKKATKRLRVVEALRKSGNSPQWMVFTVLPVLPPDLRPMVQLDGGRFATSDLNDLYRRVINRNNRLKRLLELGAPEIIIRNEKRMLQEAVDSLIDNGRRGRAVSGSGNHKLKSLSDMLKGKQGRFRQNLLGKRVDYSGRSVIVVGPELKLHQCGLPKRMALELFKPFVMHKLVSRGIAHNIKSAKRYVERARPEVWDVLDEVIQDRPVLLNRAPTLHRLGIQAFEPTLIDGSAIQIHPLVCSAFNADFDGDQMAVHVPLSREAVAEARQVMLSTLNLLSPSSGEPTVAPTLDMVLGCYYMTVYKPDGKGEFREPSNGTPAQGIYGSFEEAKLAYDLGMLDLQAKIRVRDLRTEGELIETSIGRVLFNEVLPAEMPYYNEVMDKKNLKRVVGECYERVGNERTAEIVDHIKNVGFRFATRSGVTIAVNDIKVPDEKAALLEEADGRIAEIEDQFQMGLMTEDERYQEAVKVWNETTNAVQQAISDKLRDYGSVYFMANSGAKGNITQIRQMAGMRGLMTDPSGRIIELPIRSSFREGLSVLEYFISTHGARKGLADTALRTADSGYLTRRLIDVAQDVIILEEDCGTTLGSWIQPPEDPSGLESLGERIRGRFAAQAIVDDTTGEILCEQNQEIDNDIVARVEAAGLRRVYVRSPLSCQSRRGVCQTCYGRSLATGGLVREGEAVGIIAAQSIGEPGTQLTMRTFHTGGVAGTDITSGLPRVEELFEARVPKGQAIIAEIDGIVEVLRDGESRKIRVTSTETYADPYEIPEGGELLVANNDYVDAGQVLARAAAPAEASEGAVAPLEVVAHINGTVVMDRPGRLSIVHEVSESREYPIPASSRLRVDNGEYIQAGQQITEGSKNPQDILRIQGREEVQRYLVDEVQAVYRSQGVNINDKHIETITRQMLRKVRVDSPGDTGLLPGELIDRFTYEEINAKVLAEGGEPATAQTVLLGVTKASLNTESFLAAASFQETTRVLTEAAISGMTDRLMGLKENVIIGKLIPARAEIVVPKRERPRELDMEPEDLLREERELEAMLAERGDYDTADFDDDEDDEDEDFELESDAQEDSQASIEDEDLDGLQEIGEAAEPPTVGAAEVAGEPEDSAD